ncbi:monocarboxylate transporter 2-like protein [Lates japonicus]|uniref:Monocarboxylate transporter 2-like protein n=1 Tax=Lates japonicus TaxID=270547 RepID=A0AAD3MA08_LATJO|nr:monocarboxylate transporter 2-like protein [Lates japonicus]
MYQPQPGTAAEFIAWAIRFQGLCRAGESIMPPAAASNLGYTPPDGGWGWAVVFAAFISIGFSYAFPKSLTIYFKEIQEYFSVSYSEIAWVSSVMLASMYAGGPVSSVLVNRYGSRPVVMVGGLMVSAAMVLASFGTTIIHLYLCVGVIGGFGLAFNLQPALTIIGTYFQVKRPLANGLAMTGSPVVLSTLAPLNQFLFDSFGWRGSFLILGSIVLNCCVAGALMRPVKKSVQPKPKTEPPECNRAAAEDTSAQLSNLLTEESPSESRSQSCMHKFIDFSLFKHRGFLIYLIGLVVYAVFFGLAFGMVSALLFEALMDLVGAHRFSTAVGLVTIIECGPVLLGPPISGALVDIFGDYKYMYYACGVFMLVPGIFFFIMHYYNYKKLHEEQRQSVIVEMRTSKDTIELKMSQDDKTVHETDG